MLKEVKVGNYTEFAGTQKYGTLCKAVLNVTELPGTALKTCHNVKTANDSEFIKAMKDEKDEKYDKLS